MGVLTLAGAVWLVRCGAVRAGEPVASGLALDESATWSANWTHAAAHVMSPPLRAPHHKHALQKAGMRESMHACMHACDQRPSTHVTAYACI